MKSESQIVLYKRVSAELKTQERTKNETLWMIGAELEIKEPNFSVECGPGKFHACSKAYLCDEFRSEQGDRYIAIQVARKDLHAFEKPQYPYKIAFSKAKVLYECDRYGVKL